jgi:hypothetical protein
VPSTWETWAPKAGVDLSQYPTAGSAPPSVQFAVFAADYNAQGFSDWTCSGCDAKLTTALANLGGPGAFAAPGTLSTNPTAYAALDAPGAVQSYFAGQGSDPLGGSAAVYGTGDASLNPGYTGAPNGTLGGALGTVGGAVGAGADTVVAFVSTPFSNAYSVVSDTALSKITAATTNTMAMAASLFAILLVLAYMIQGAQVWYGRRTLEQIGWFTLRAGLVAPFLLGSYWFNAVFVQFVSIDAPKWISDNLGPAIGVGAAAATPAGNFDAAALNFLNILVAIKSGGAWVDFMLPVVLGLCLLFMIGVLALMFSPFILLTAAMDFVVLLLPLLMMGIPFDATRRYFYTAMNVIVFILLGYVFVDVITQIFINDIAQQLASVPVHAGSWTAAVALVMVVIHVMLIGLLLPVGWYIAKTIGNAAGVPISIPTPMSVVQRGLRWA